MAKQPEPAQESSLYEHKQEAIQRPDVGVQEGFRDHKPPSQYRYDSSLSPELCWDETAGREFAEWLLMRITELPNRAKPPCLPRRKCGKARVRNSVVSASVSRACRP